MLPAIGTLVVDSSFGHLVRQTLDALPRETLRDDPGSIYEMAVTVVGQNPCSNVFSHYFPGLKVNHLSIF